MAHEKVKGYELNVIHVKAKQFKPYLVTIFALLLLIISRFVLLEQSARFIWDESDDLLRMKEIYDHKRITLVGPIAGNNINIYGSLSYYMLMPFAASMHFDPLGPVVGTAFYSVIFAVLLAYFFYRKMYWSFPVATIFLTLVFPFVQTGRWAWNPHYIPFWQTLSLCIFLIPQVRKKWWAWIIFGFLQGLGIHNHWYAVFAVIGIGIALAVYFLPLKKVKPLLAYLLGAAISVLPFILFDILRPPGLFISRFLYFNPLTQSLNDTQQIDYLSRIWQLPYQFFHYFFQEQFPALFFMGVTAVYIVVLYRRKRYKKCILLIPVIMQIVALMFIRTQVNDHYFLPAVIPFLLFLAFPGEEKGFSFLQKSILVLFLAFSLPAGIEEIFKNNWSTNIRRTKAITHLIQDNLEGRCNVLAIASTDSGTTGKKYRDLLEIWGTKILGKEEYTDYDCLFVVSTSNLATVQKDPSYELNLVRKNYPKNTWTVEDWHLYKFVRAPSVHTK